MDPNDLDEEISKEPLTPDQQAELTELGAALDRDESLSPETRQQMLDQRKMLSQNRNWSNRVSKEREGAETEAFHEKFHNAVSEQSDESGHNTDAVPPPSETPDSKQ